MYYYDILTYLIQRTPIVVSLLLGLEGGERCPKLRAIENDPDCTIGTGTERLELPNQHSPPHQNTHTTNYPTQTNHNKG